MFSMASSSSVRSDNMLPISCRTSPADLVRFFLGSGVLYSVGSMGDSLEVAVKSGLESNTAFLLIMAGLDAHKEFVTGLGS